MSVGVDSRPSEWPFGAGAVLVGSATSYTSNRYKIQSATSSKNVQEPKFPDARGPVRSYPLPSSYYDCAVVVVVVVVVVGARKVQSTLAPRSIAKLLLLAARACAAARGASISWLARAETRVLALSSPEIYFEISFVGICGVFSKKNAHTAACTGPKTCSAVRFASFFRCFPVCVAFRIGICSVLAISRLSAHASFDLHLFLNSVRGFGGGMGGGG